MSLRRGAVGCCRWGPARSRSAGPPPGRGVPWWWNNAAASVFLGRCRGLPAEKGTPRIAINSRCPHDVPFAPFLFASELPLLKEEHLMHAEIPEPILLTHMRNPRSADRVLFLCHHHDVRREQF